MKRNTGLTANERILYSFLLSKSIARAMGMFDPDGEHINEDDLGYYIEERGVPLVEMSKERIARELSMSRRSVINAFRKFWEKGIIKDGIGEKILFVSSLIYKCGFFELLMNSRLNGELLIFYSYLVSKGERYGYSIDTFTSKLADDYGKTPNTISQYLKRLKAAGLTRRGADGRLDIELPI